MEKKGGGGEWKALRIALRVTDMKTKGCKSNVLMDIFPYSGLTDGIALFFF